MLRLRSRRARLAAAALAVSTAVAVSLVALPAYAESGSITGHLLDGGSPVAAAVVELYTVDFESVANTTTDELGAFELADVAIGDYKLGFRTPELVQYAYQSLDFYAADVITVTDGATTTVDDSVLPHGSLSGRVTHTDGSPFVAPYVTAQALDGDYFGQTNGDADGNYSIAFLPPGSYAVSFRASFSSAVQYANQRTRQQDADPIAITVGETTQLDQVFLDTGTVRGSFTDGGVGVPDVSVSVSDASTGESTFTQTDADGQFQVTVWPGHYRVEFNLPDNRRQYAHQQRNSEDADIITVAAGADVVVDETAIPTGTVSGRLTNPDGAPVAGAGVSVSDGVGDFWTTTDDNGAYQIQAYPSSYRVSFGINGMGVQWAHGKSRAGLADRFTVVAGGITTVDDTLVNTGGLHVTAKDAATGAAVTDFCVYVPMIVDWQCAESGAVDLSGMLPGEYEVNTTVEDESYLYNRTAPAVVASDATANLVMSLVRPAKIRTTVRDAATGAPVAGVCVETARPQRTGIGVNVNYCSDEHGRVTVGNLTAGSYNLFAWSPDRDHGHQWVGSNGGTGAQAKAKLVTVRTGQTVSIPAIRLDRAGTITGVVKNKKTGQPILDAVVGLSTFNSGYGFSEAHVLTDAVGRYTWAGLGPYEWPLYFWSYGLAGQWSGGTPNRLTATGVKVTAGSTKTYNQALVKGSTLTVTVVGPGGVPIESARVTAFNAASSDELAAGDCGAGTACVVRLLGSQGVKLNYYVRINGENYAGYYKDAADFQHGSIVLVPAIGTKRLTLVASRRQF